MKSELRFCADIDMFVIDRPKTTCKWRTKFCNENCYNNKLYKLFKGMKTKDDRNELYWRWVTGNVLNKELARKKHQTQRIRLMSRGEGIKDLSDIDRVIDICKANKNRLIWLPTRAWRSKQLRPVIQEKLFSIKNLRICASIDPTNNKDEIDNLLNDGWSTMFFGDDENAPIENSIKCKKTWNHSVGHCSKCKNGCFNKAQSHIWLKSH